MSILIQNASILTMDDQSTEYDCADIWIENSKIKAIGPNLPIANQPNLRVIDATGQLAMPGLINGHFHSPGNFMKGVLDDTPLEIFMLHEVPPLLDTPASPRLSYIRTLLGCIEMLKLGVTSVYDDAYYTPLPTAAGIDALMQAYGDSGIRATATLDQPNVIEYEKYPFLKDLLPADIKQSMAQLQPSTDYLLEQYDYLIHHWHGACNGRLQAAVSCSAPQRVTVDYFKSLSNISRDFDLSFSVHTLETRLQRVLGDQKYGKSLIQYVADLGLLDERMLLIHAIWIDQADIELIAQSKCTVAHNPICNLKLGSGVMPFRQLRNHDIPICLGSDEAASDDTINLWNVAKCAGLIHKITDPEYRNWPKAPEILWSLIRGGAKGMRLDQQVGVLAPGYEADLILLRLDSLAFTPLNDLKRQLVFCEDGSSVVLTMVAGKIVMKNGKVTTVDEEAVKAEVHELSVGYRDELEQANLTAKTLEPYYRQMYLKSLQHPVAINRWVSPRPGL